MNLIEESTFLRASISFSKILTILFFKNSELLGVMATDVPVNDLHEFIYYPLVRKQLSLSFSYKIKDFKTILQGFMDLHISYFVLIDRS